MSRVLVPLAKGFEEIEAVTIIDVLRRADIEVIIGTLGDEFLIEGANGIKVQAEKPLKEIEAKDIDMIVLPGGWDGTHALADDATVQKLLQEMDIQKKEIGAICAAPFALNRAGVLKGRYTCYPSVEKEIKKDGYEGEKYMVVEEENIMTSRGPATALCFALKIVQKLEGEEKYNLLKDGLLATYCK